MSDKKSFYITTTLPYVNADPHIGFAMELVQADVIARWKKSQGYEVFFNTGTDEHGQKIWQKAQDEGKEVQEYVDLHAEKFKDLIKLLNLSEDVRFIRTTDERHKKAAQVFWKKCDENGDIYKKQYKSKYCVGCELEKTDSELEHGKCPIHPDRDLEIREEENYFFRFSKYGDKLLELYDKGLVIPDTRANEMRELIKRGLEDFSISRLKEKMSWGVEVPGDEEHVMYVWFDALVNYISTLGWPEDTESFAKWWPGVQFAGKDQVRQQAAMWQAMLMSAGLPTSEQVVIHGFLNMGGQKMSKSLGNVISPEDMIQTFHSDTDVVRFMMCAVNQFEDTDVSLGFKDAGFDLTYKTNLVDGLGNLVARVMKLAETHLVEGPKIKLSLPKEYTDALDRFEIKKSLDIIFTHVSLLDKNIQEKEPFKVIKEDKELGTTLILEAIGGLYVIARMLLPFMPETSKKISDAIEQHKKPENLFPRIG